mgnify:CR=1 FL=1
MHNAIVKAIKYLLWTILSFIIIVLIIWLSKSNRDLPAYIGLLNQTNISDLWWKSIFQSILWDRGAVNTWDIVNPNSTWKTDQSGFQNIEEEKEEGLDVYDPQFEQDMQDVSIDSILSGEEEGYGFKQEATTTNKTTVTTKTWTIDAQQKLIELINKNEMKK